MDNATAQLVALALRARHRVQWRCTTTGKLGDFAGYSRSQILKHVRRASASQLFDYVIPLHTITTDSP